MCIRDRSRSNRSVYIRRHISTSGNAQLVAKRARPKSMENSSLHRDNKLRKSYYFSTETLICGHKCTARLQPTPYFHFRLGAKWRQTCTAWVNGKNSYDHSTWTAVHSLVFALKRWISGQKQRGPQGRVKISKQYGLQFFEKSVYKCVRQLKCR